MHNFIDVLVALATSPFIVFCVVMLVVACIFVDQQDRRGDDS